MKRRQLVRELEQHGCRLLRAGARHDIYWNPQTADASPSPAIPKLTSIWPGTSGATCWAKVEPARPVGR
jgi:hypothetical protein